MIEKCMIGVEFFDSPVSLDGADDADPYTYY